MKPTEDQALQFCVMLQAGLPASEAIRYFIDSDDPLTLATSLQTWQRSPAVKKALITLQGKSWTEMSLDEQCKAALNIHYAGLAFFLYSNNFSEVGPTDKAKLDTARQAIEAKLAGMAGKTDALSQFLSDVQTGKVRLNPVVKVQ